MTETSQKVRRWLTGKALPLWSSAGVDPEGGFTERLTMTGAPDFGAAKRVRVQARQIYVFSHASLIGLWPAGADLARRAFEFIQRTARRDDGAFVHLLDRRGRVLDAKCDTYDHAFLLYAFGWLYCASGAPEVRQAIEDIAATIEARLRHPSGQGYLEDEIGPGPVRRQNPHMHLFEAFLSAYAATGDKRFLERAAAIRALFAARFYDPKARVLREFFTDAWQPASGEDGTILEPGHHCEWAWLLHQFGRAAGTAPPAEAEGLLAFARASGTEPGSGLLHDEVWLGGRVKKASKRCWPQTEALKAEIVTAESEGRPVPARADDIIANLFRYYLDTGCPGGWNDIVDEANQPIAEFMPASTFYHVFLAFAEYLRVADGLKPKA
jgi:mannose/cellobiose epimerase-like protein (N-acyl-D-glucosamine 2-epimerase family)